MCIGRSSNQGVDQNVVTVTAEVVPVVVPGVRQAGVLANQRQVAAVLQVVLAEPVLAAR